MKKIIILFLFLFYPFVFCMAATTSIFPGSTGVTTLPTSGAGSYIIPLGSIGGGGFTESQWNYICSTSGTFSNLRILLDVAPGTGTSRTFAIRKNGTDTAVTCTISDTATSNQDTTHSFTVVAGDLITIGCLLSGTPAASVCRYSVQFIGDNTGESMMSYNIGGTNLSTTSTEYLPLIGAGSFTGTEVIANVVMTESATLKNLYVNLDTAPGAGTSRVFTVRKNGATPASSLTTTISDTATSNQDTTNTVSVVAGDIVCIMSEFTGTPAASKVRIGLTYVSGVDGNFMLTQQNSGLSGGLLNNAATEFIALQDNGAAPSNVETGWQQAMQACTVKSSHVKLTGAPGAGKSFAFTLRVNTADSSPALTTTVSGTDTYATTATDVTINNDDILCTTIVPSGTPTASRCSISYLISTGGGGSPNPDIESWMFIVD